MIYETLDLTVTEEPAALTVYAPDNSVEIDPNRTRPAIIMCPGGGYGFCSDREAEPVALQLLARDICVFLLRYAVAPARYPVALTQLAYVMQYVRTHAAQYHVDPHRVSVMGYSAGGHLAASLGVRWHEPWLAERLGCKPEDLRPDGMVLCYPVITASTLTHAGSMENLLGTTDRTQWESQSLELLVRPDTPPAFIWHTFEDELVPVENSLGMACALRKAGVSTELHIYPHGPHGLSLANDLTGNPDTQPEFLQPEVQGWIDLAARWIKSPKR